MLIGCWVIEGLCANVYKPKVLFKNVVIFKRNLRRLHIPKDVEQTSGSFSQFIVYGVAVFSMVLYTSNRYVSCTSVTGHSMQPTINPEKGVSNDKVLLDRTPIRDHTVIQRGDVVTYKTTRDPTSLNIKRVVGLEGDTVTTLGYKKKFVKVPPGHCWVEGDNHATSDDSNKVGPIPMGLITGRATHIVYPFSRWQRLGRRFPHSRIKLNPNSDDTQVRHLPTIISPRSNLHRS